MNFITGKDTGAGTSDADQQGRPAVSNIAPETDAVIDVGTKTKRFRNGSFVTTTVRIDSIDMSGVNPDSAKGAVSVGGLVELETDESISAGELMMYMSDSYGELKCKSLDSDVTPQHLFAGVAIGDTLPGGVVQIMNRGLTTCVFDTQYEDPSTTGEVRLDNSTNAGVYTVGTTPINFRDSGGLPDSYENSEYYQIFFQAFEGGTINLQFNAFEFEHTSTRAYDRLYVDYGTDAVNGTYTRASIPWCQTMADDSLDSSYFANNGSWNEPDSANGGVVPENVGRANSINSGTFGDGTVNTGVRFVRFTFISDSSGRDPGWDISITGTESVGSSGVGLPVSLFQSLYATGAGAGNVKASTLASATNMRIGFTVGSNTDDQKVFMMVE